jgi:serine/threonine protein kinase
MPGSERSVSGSALPQPGDLIAGKYRIEREIGRGGMSVVFGARHAVTGRRFALKWLLPEISVHPDAAERFIRESQVSGRLQHPNVVEVFDIGQDAGTHYMVMEWLAGESLADRLERVGALSVRDACGYLIPCMRGVAAAHAAGIVHRDLKPANIFLCEATKDSSELPKVLDFGISKLSISSGDVHSPVTSIGILLGTPHYMAPEQMQAEPVDARTDVYAFGVILYQLLSGSLPFPATNYGALVVQVATETPRPLQELVPTLPAGVADCVARAMARAASDRFQNLHALITALEPYATGTLPRPSHRGTYPTFVDEPVVKVRPFAAPGLPASARPSKATPATPARRRRQLALYLGACVFVAIATALSLQARNREQRAGQRPSTTLQAASEAGTPSAPPPPPVATPRASPSAATSQTATEPKTAIESKSATDTKRATVALPDRAPDATPPANTRALNPAQPRGKQRPRSAKPKAEAPRETERDGAHNPLDMLIQ